MIVLESTGPEPITLADAKKHLRVDGTDDDAMITMYITAARSHVERFTGLALVTQRLRMRAEPPEVRGPAWLNEWRVRLPLGPALSVVSVSNDAGDDVGVTYSAADQVTILTVSQSEPATIEWTVAAPLAIAPEIKIAMMLLIHQMNDNRAGVPPEAVERVEEAYLRKHRVLLGMA